MISLFLLWALAGPPDECADRTPGLSKCVEYYPKTVDKGVVTEWGCKAACYVRKTGEKDDGGTDARIVYGSGADKHACHHDLKAQSENGCKAVKK